MERLEDYSKVEGVNFQRLLNVFNKRTNLFETESDFLGTDECKGMLVWCPFAPSKMGPFLFVAVNLNSLLLIRTAPFEGLDLLGQTSPLMKNE